MKKHNFSLSKNQYPRFSLPTGKYGTVAEATARKAAVAIKVRIILANELETRMWCENIILSKSVSQIYVYYAYCFWSFVHNTRFENCFSKQSPVFQIRSASNSLQFIVVTFLVFFWIRQESVLVVYLRSEQCSADLCSMRFVYQTVGSRFAKLSFISPESAWGPCEKVGRKSNPLCCIWIDLVSCHCLFS